MNRHKKLVLLVGLCLLAVVAAGFLGASFLFTDEPDLADPSYRPDRIIDHNDIAYIHEYLTYHPQITEAIAGQRWYFAHASVGSNMLDGMKALHDADPTAYPLTVETAEMPAPGRILTGVIYEDKRGNPGPARKLRLFEEALGQNGWDVAGIAMNKFCYIDAPTYDPALGDEGNLKSAEAQAVAYLVSMEILAAEHPATRLVYTTMPLTVRGEQENRMRAAFNQRVREECAANGFFLFDIADIQSHDDKGEVSLIASVECMQGRYSGDGGHLNARGQKRVAKGWYALAAALAEE